MRAKAWGSKDTVLAVGGLVKLMPGLVVKTNVLPPYEQAPQVTLLLSVIVPSGGWLGSEGQRNVGTTIEYTLLLPG